MCAVLAGMADDVRSEQQTQYNLDPKLAVKQSRVKSDVVAVGAPRLAVCVERVARVWVGAADVVRSVRTEAAVACKTVYEGAGDVLGNFVGHPTGNLNKVWHIAVGFAARNEVLWAVESIATRRVAAHVASLGVVVEPAARGEVCGWPRATNTCHVTLQ
jgi:hypothetical protein